MDRLLVAGAVLLLILEVTFLVSDLGGGSGSFLLSTHQNTASQLIGEMNRADNQVRRRARESLVWDESKKADQLYEYDSILTLAGSSAQLRLKGDSLLNLDENTLIVLEPPGEQGETGIRIRFTRGNLRTRASGGALMLEGKSWTLNANAGSVVSLVSQGEGDVEVEVESGKVELSNSDGKQELAPGERLSIDKSGAQTKKSVSKDMRWNADVPKRIYARTFPVDLNVSWNGPAQSIEVLDPSRVAASRPIANPNENQASISLELGTSILRLENSNETSESLSIQVRAAPKLLYFSPLPRDSVAVSKEILFSWEPIASAHGYHLEISTSPEFTGEVRRHDTSEPSITTSIDKEGTYYWRVGAVDEDGYQIPSPRSYPLNAVPNPLEAPRLNPPIIRDPASELPERTDESQDGASLWNIFLGPRIAWAKEQKPLPPLEAEFSWAEVPGADHYVIEISKTPGFEQLHVKERVETARYVWRSHQGGVFFWRVAAGQTIILSDGKTERLGPFSGPSTVRLERMAVVASKTSPTPEPVEAGEPALAIPPTPLATAPDATSPSPLVPAANDMGAQMKDLISSKKKVSKEEKGARKPFGSRSFTHGDRKGC